MTYQNVLKATGNFTEKYDTVEKALQAYMAVKRKGISIEKINKALNKTAPTGEKYTGPLLQDKFTKTEKKERAALAVKIREKMARYAISHRMNDKQAVPLIAAYIAEEGSRDKTVSDSRYPEEIMYDFSGTEAAAEKNAKISALFINARNAAGKMSPKDVNPYAKDFNKAHEELIRRFENYNVDGLLDHELSDAELVENFEIIEECKALCMQVQNIRDTYREMKIPLPESLKMRMNALVPKLRILEKFEQRLGVIDSPYYPEIDPEDPALAETEKGVGEEIMFTLDDDNPVPDELGTGQSSEYAAYAADAAGYNKFYYMAENEAIGEMIQRLGAKKEDIVFEIDGQAAEPFYQREDNGNYSVSFSHDTIPKLNGGTIGHVRIYDRTDPNREMVLPKTNGKHYHFNRALQGKTTIQEPQRPQPVQEPHPVKKWLNSWFFGVFQKEVDDYAKYQKESAEYDAKLAAFRQEVNVINGIKNNFETKLAQKAAEEKKKAEIEEIKSRQPGKAVEKGMERMLSVYSNKPRYLNEEAAKSANSIYGHGKVDEKKFKELKSFEIKGITIGGKQISEQEFAALAMAGTMKPGSGVTKFLRENPAEPRGNCDEDYLIVSNQTMFTADIATGRDNSFADYFDGIKQGRMTAYEALQEHKQGKSDKLAALLADGMVKMQLWFRDMGTGTPAADCPVEFYSKMADLIERDKKLSALVDTKMKGLMKDYAQKEKDFKTKAAESYKTMETLGEGIKGMADPNTEEGKKFGEAMEQYEINRTAYDHYRGIRELGVSLKNALKTIKSFRIANQLSKEANQARDTLREAALSGQPLDKETKKKCIRAMLRTAAMQTNQAAQEEDSVVKAMEEYEGPQTKMVKKGDKCKPKARAHLVGSYQFAESRPVAIMEQLSNKDGIEKLDDYVNMFIKPETVNEMMNKSEKELVLQFDHGKLTARMIKDKAELVKMEKQRQEMEEQRRREAGGNSKGSELGGESTRKVRSMA